MYVYELFDILKKLSYKGTKDFCTLTEIEIPEKEQWMLDLTVYITIKDRLSGEDRKIYRHHVFQADELKQMNETRLLRAVRDLLIWLESHEVEEQLIYGNRRVFDPHAPLAGGTNVVREKKQYEKRIESVKKQVIEQLHEHQNKESSNVGI